MKEKVTQAEMIRRLKEATEDEDKYFPGVLVAQGQIRRVVEGFAHLGLPERLAFGLGVLELACTVGYVIPRTSVLGAVLLTGYLGGATLTHLRVGDPFFMPVIAGVLIWGGLFLRDPRLRALIPLRRLPK